MFFFNLDLYKGTIIKLVNFNNGAEIYGYLEDVKGNTIVLNKAIISMNKFNSDPAGTMDAIITGKYQAVDGNVLTLPASTIYPNYNDKHITYLNIDMFLFVPLYDNNKDNNKDNKDKNIDNSSNVLDIKKTFEDYIEYIYTTMNDIFNVHQLNLKDNERESNEV
jgi:hypothetical protein